MQKLKEWVGEITGLLREQPLQEKIGDRHFKVVPGENGLVLGDEIKPKVAPLWPTAVQLKTVTGIVDAVTQGLDDMKGTGIRFAVHVKDTNSVAIVSLDADEFGRRREWAVATCEEKNPFPFDQYISSETFLIKLQAGFMPTESVVALQRLASNLTSETSVNVQDDGFSQQVIFKGGGVQTGSVDVPKRLKLLAYRTFREIDPIESEFTVRLKAEKDDVPTIALLQVDADKWKHDTIRVLHAYLTRKLPNGTPVIA